MILWSIPVGLSRKGMSVGIGPCGEGLSELAVVLGEWVITVVVTPDQAEEIAAELQRAAAIARQEARTIAEGGAL